MAEQLEMLREIVSMAAAGLGEALGRMLEGKAVSLSIEKEAIATKDEVLKEYPSGAVCASFAFGGELTGNMHLVLATQDAIQLAHAAMGMPEESGDEFGDFERDVLNHVFQEGGEGLVSTIGEFVGKSTSLQQATIVEEVSDQEGVAFTGPMTIGEEVQTQFHLFVSKSLADQIVNALVPGQEEKAEEPSVEQQVVEHKPEQPAVEEKPAQKATEEEKAVAQPVKFTPFEQPPPETQKMAPNLDLVLDVPMEITVELGRAKKAVREILELGTGSIIELDKLDGEPVDVLANGKLFAKGEVVVIGETFGVRVVEIVSSAERLRRFAE